ncbi:hypothetical protein ACQ4PT_034756 [Festuca glaucescens]
MVNRLRPYLQHLIDETQSAFIPGRLISDNDLIAFECFHAIQRNRKTEDFYCAYKLDLSKAYDRVDWGFLDGLLRKWGFDDKWVRLIMACVTTVKFCVQVNGNVSDKITPTRGLREGGRPLSPYLFLFVTDSLSKMIQKHVHDQGLKDLKICRTLPGISHLLFIDDCMLFYKAENDQAKIIKAIITSFEKGSGQLLSASKCSIMFGESCQQQSQDEVRLTLEVERTDFEDKYLGLPTPEGRMKKDKFEPSKERLGKKVNNWAEKYMSMGAKEDLIKICSAGHP